MDDRSALMAAIIANPDEDTPRLAFADWLDEHGDKHDRARAEHIRCQIATDRGGPGAKAAKTKAAALRKSHLKRWLGALATTETRFVDHTFARGLLNQWFVSAGDFLKIAHQAAVTEWFPRVGVGRIVFYEPTKRAEKLFASPALAWTSDILWHDAKLDDAGFVALAKSPHLSRLSRLAIDKPRCSDRGLRALANSPGLGSLRTLTLQDGLWGGKFTAAGVRLVLESENLPRLDELSLVGAQKSAVTHRTFFTYKALARLRVLHLPGNTDMKALAKCPYLANLDDLYVRDAEITDADAVALADSPVLAKLKSLELVDMNVYRSPLSADAEKRLRDRFGDRLRLTYSILCRR